MYKDHRFCSERCRGSQISLDMKIMNLRDQYDNAKTVRALENPKIKSKSGQFLQCKVRSHDGTPYMRVLGIKSVIVELQKNQRPYLVNKVVAGFIRWQGKGLEGDSSDSDGTTEVTSLETHAALMCFKTKTALEVMLCDDSTFIPENLVDLEVSAVLELRRKIDFRQKANLKQQITMDRGASRYLKSSTALSRRSHRNNKKNNTNTRRLSSSLSSNDDGEKPQLHQYHPDELEQRIGRDKFGEDMPQTCNVCSIM